MKTSWLVVFALAAAVAACSGGDGPTNPDPGQNPGNNGGNTGGNTGGGGATSTGPDTVYVNSLSFSPSSLTVSPGDTVIWMMRESGTTHTVTPNGHSAFSRAESSTAGEMMRVVFSATGSYAYFCEPHRGSGMTGSITVQ